MLVQRMKFGIHIFWVKLRYWLDFGARSLKTGVVGVGGIFKVKDFAGVTLQMGAFAILVNIVWTISKSHKIIDILLHTATLDGMI